MAALLKLHIFEILHFSLPKVNGISITVKFSHWVFSIRESLLCMPPAPIAVLLRNFRLMVQTSVSSALHICLPAAPSALLSQPRILLSAWETSPSLHLTKSLRVKDLIKSHLGHAAFPDYPMHSSPSSPLTSHKLLFMVLFEAYIFFLALCLLCTNLSFLL